VDSQSFAPIDLHKADAASDWLLIKMHCIGMKGLPGVQLQINQITAAIDMIIAFTGKNMFYFNKKSEMLRKI
jgi:hypothetical protein